MILSLADLHTLPGQINRRKQPNAPQHTPNQSSGYRPRPSFPYSPRSIPYVRGRGQAFQNRSLIANNRAKPVHASSAPSISPPDQIEKPRAENLNPMPRGIAKYGRGARAWISEDALRHQLERQKYHSNSLQATGEDSVIHQSVASGSDTPTPSTAYITVADIPFQVTNGGSKLLRTTGMLKFRLCRRRTRSDFDRHLDPHEAHPERGSSQWGHLQALEEWKPRPCCSCAPGVRSPNRYTISKLLTCLTQAYSAKRQS